MSTGYNYSVLFKKMGYYMQFYSTQYQFYYKDAGDIYKVILVIRNHDRCNIVDRNSLELLQAKIRLLPVFLHQKDIRFLTILTHTNKKDRIPFKEKDVLLLSNDYSDRHGATSALFREEVQELSVLRRERTYRHKLDRISTHRNAPVFPVCTILLVMLCTTLYLMNIDAVSYGLSKDNIEKGCWYTLFTYAYVHAGFFHLLGNMISLCVIGSMLEKRIGNLKYLGFVCAVSLYTGMLGAAGKFYFLSKTTTVGFSGVIYAMLGCLIVYQISYRERSGALCVFVAMALIKSMFLPSVDVGIHIIGLLVGIFGGINFKILNMVMVQDLRRRMTEEIITKCCRKSPCFSNGDIRRPM